VFSPERILDRGRLLIGVMLVAPLATLIPAVAAPGGGTGPQWSLVASTPNPITESPDAQDILANLTNPTVADAPAAGKGDAGADTTGASAPAASGPAAGEVGSESPDDGAPPEAVQIEGTPPDADLAAKLRAAESRFAPRQPALPSGTPGSPSGGPIPLATPSRVAYPVAQGTAHVFPVVGGASFSNDWGAPRPGGRSHQGIDLFAATGTPIVAISDGVLFKVGWNRVGGWRFWLRDRWGNEFYHAHLSAFAPAAKEGAVVSAGTVIGFVGNTGDARTTPPHLHFEIHPGGGGPIPPFSYVSAWPRLAP
jgi:murein DD-endopeptidase MepM/ murein hydrolase activator NlpD